MTSKLDDHIVQCMGFKGNNFWVWKISVGDDPLSLFVLKEVIISIWKAILIFSGRIWWLKYVGYTLFIYFFHSGDITLM